MRFFIYASVLYLAAATVIGIINGIAGPSYLGQFSHTHFNLLGFMSMMVFGIGYFILPRFNGTDLKFPGWVAIHFWTGNISLIGMVLFRGLAIESGQMVYQGLFITSATLQAVSIFMFVINIWFSLSQTVQPKKQETPSASGRVVLPGAPPVSEKSSKRPKSSGVPVQVDANSRVADLIDRLSDIKGLLVEAGLSSLALPGHIDRVRAMGVTLGMACRNHGLDLDEILTDVREKFGDAGFEVVRKPQNRNESIITGDNLIGEVIQNYPESRAVFQKHFGSGCFDCPGQAFESVEMACRMHGVEVDSFLESVNEAVAG